MPESSIGITDGSGKNLATFSRSIASTTREVQYIVPGEFVLPTYTAFVTARANTALSHLLVIQGDATNYGLLRRLTIKQANIATASTMEIKVFRTTTAPVGGTSVSGRSFDLGDTTPYAGVITSLPTTKGTESDLMLQFRIGLASANPITKDNMGEWVQAANSKPIRFGTTPGSGLAVKNIGSSATEFDIEAEFVVAPYL